MVGVCLFFTKGNKQMHSALSVSIRIDGSLMFTLLVLISWIAAAVALSGAAKRSRKKPPAALPGQVDKDFQMAQSHHDHDNLIRYYRIALDRASSEIDRHLIRINLAYSLTAIGQYESALAELDKISLRQLAGQQVALWLNNRAYILLHLNQLDEAMEHLQDAQEFVTGDVSDPTLAACISGTRGMVLFKKGELERAESALQLALRLETDATTTRFDNIANPLEGDPYRAAERWFWLSEISLAKKEYPSRLTRLQQAARYPFTKHGQQAIRILSSGGLSI